MMDFGRIVQMIINVLLRKAVNGGVNAAIRKVSRKDDPTAPISPEDRQQQQAARQMAKRARQAMKIGRKL